jgi:uncharacterized membrane protein YgcG
MAMDGNEPFWLFAGVVAIMAAFALVRKLRGRAARPGAPRWGRKSVDLPAKPVRTSRTGHWENDSSRGPGSTDGGASDGGGADGGRA